MLTTPIDNEQIVENKIVVANKCFSVANEYCWLAEDQHYGAIITFTGKVRDHNLGDNVSALTLEHYPGMTEKALLAIAEEARQRWSLGRISIYHRVGELFAGDEIVFVGVASVHRGSGFNACEFIMDHLKTKAPFWKHEATQEGHRWVEAHEKDNKAASRW